jgi:hypothetical protein
LIFKVARGQMLKREVDLSELTAHKPREAAAGG